MLKVIAPSLHHLCKRLCKMIVDVHFEYWPHQLAQNQSLSLRFSPVNDIRGDFFGCSMGGSPPKNPFFWGKKKGGFFGAPLKFDFSSVLIEDSFVDLIEPGSFSIRFNEFLCGNLSKALFHFSFRCSRKDKLHLTYFYFSLHFHILGKK